jgi:hypothetical protein
MRIPRLYDSSRNRSGEEGMHYEWEFKGFYSEEGLFPWSSLASSWTGGNDGYYPPWLIIQSASKRSLPEHNMHAGHFMFDICCWNRWAGRWQGLSYITNMQLLHQMCKLAMMMHLLHSVLPVKLSLGKPSSGTAGKMELPCCVSFSFCYIEILAKFNNNIAKLFNFTLEK